MTDKKTSPAHDPEFHRQFREAMKEGQKMEFTLPKNFMNRKARLRARALSRRANKK